MSQNSGYSEEASGRINTIVVINPGQAWRTSIAKEALRIGSSVVGDTSTRRLDTIESHDIGGAIVAAVSQEIAVG